MSPAPGPGRDFDGCPKFCGLIIARAVLVMASSAISVVVSRRVTTRATGNDSWCCGPTLAAGVVGGAGAIALTSPRKTRTELPA